MVKNEWPEELPDLQDTGKKQRGYAWTINNYGEETSARILEFCAAQRADYIIGYEIGSVNKTPHLQGYCYFRNAMKWDTVRRGLAPDGRIFLKQAYKGKLANWRYCSKGGVYDTNSTFVDRPRQ